MAGRAWDVSQLSANPQTRANPASVYFSTADNTLVRDCRTGTTEEDHLLWNRTIRLQAFAVCLCACVRVRVCVCVCLQSNKHKPIHYLLTASKKNPKAGCKSLYTAPPPPYWERYIGKYFPWYNWCKKHCTFYLFLVTLNFYSYFLLLQASSYLQTLTLLTKISLCQCRY